MIQRLTLGLFVLAACGGGPNDADPRVVPGGGIGDGAIDGFLNVYTIDENTDEPISGATILVGEPGVEALTGVTDSTGLYRFEADLSGPQTITAVADGYVVSTWFGANGANVTMGLGSTNATTNIPQAELAGTIPGFEDLVRTSDQHLIFAGVSYTQTDELGDAANNLAPPAMDSQNCTNTVLGVNCDWRINARTGSVALYAMVIEVDTQGTFQDQTDDTYAILGWAFAPAVTVEDGVDQSGIELTLGDEGTMNTPMITVGNAPSGLDEGFTGIGVDLGEDGWMLFALPDSLDVELMVPNLSGELADGTYRAFTFASDGAENGAQAAIFVRGLADVADVNLGEFLTLPADLAVTAGTYSFTPSTEATVHIVDLQDGGDTVWNIFLADGRTEFVLPTLDPDPLPSGAFDMSVGAIEVEVNLQDFSIDEVSGTFDRISNNIQAITP